MADRDDVIERITQQMREDAAEAAREMAKRDKITTNRRNMGSLQEALKVLEIMGHSVSVRRDYSDESLMRIERITVDGENIYKA